MAKKNLVIIGGGGAGLFCGASITQMSKDFNISMISNEDLFCRCSSPYVINKKAKFKDTIMPDTMITQFGIKLLKGECTNIDNENKKVKYQTDEGKNKTLKYDVLVFATGARPFVPPIKGIENKKNVISVRTPQDIKKINTKTSKIKRCTVIGGGVIGVEMASAIRERGVQVDLIQIEDKVFHRLADTEFADLMEENLKANKINLIHNAFTKEFEAKSGLVNNIIYEQQGKLHNLKTDLVVLATGVKANTELAEEIGVKSNKFGLLVNDYFETNLQGVYAVGDVCVSKDMVTNKKSPSQLATNSVIQGKVCARNILGMKDKYIGHNSSMSLNFLGQEFGSCGLNEFMCQEQGIEYFTGTAQTTDIYQDLQGASPVQVKILFDKKTTKVLGVQAYGKNIVWIINMVSLALQNKNKLKDLMNINYVSHPAVSPWPFMNPIVMCCEQAFMQIMQNQKK